MAHYLLSSKSKTLSLKHIFRLSEDEAFKLLKANRWGNPDNVCDVCCPHCGIRHNAYFLTSRKRWCCKHCKRHFYITTNTVFAFHKVKLVDILAVIVMMVGCSNGISSIDVSRLLHLNYKTAFVLCGKVREALFKTRDLSSLSGEVHEDGMWINFTLRPTNFRKNNHKQRQQADEKGRKFPKFRPTKRCIISLNQRSANDEQIWGSNRTIVAMDYTENTDTVFALNQRFVKAGSDIMCDENPAYNNLNFHYNHWSVNHQEAYSAKGVNNNLAESFNARMRDLMRGTHHKTDNKYALHYANQAAFMSDNRRKSNGELFSDVLQRCLWVLPLKEWVGYWQGNHRQGELIGMKAFAPEEISQNYFKRLEEQMKYDEMLLAA